MEHYRGRLLRADKDMKGGGNSLLKMQICVQPSYLVLLPPVSVVGAYDTEIKEEGWCKEGHCSVHHQANKRGGL